MRAVRTALFVITIAGAALLIQAAGAAHDLADPLDLTGVALVSSEDDGDFVKETYRPTLHHSGPPGTRDFAQVSARLNGAAGLSMPGFIQVIDGDVTFGTIRASETIDSLDTFTIKRHRRVPLNPRQLRWTITARPDLVLPDEWTGKWRFTLTRTDPATRHLESTDTITDTLDRREPMGFSLLPQFIRCRWHGDADALEATCDGAFRAAWCVTHGTAVLSLHRDGESATGTGTVRVTQDGSCPAGEKEVTDEIAIDGTRLTRQADDEPLSPGVLPTFSIDPQLTLLLWSALAGPHGEPTHDEDCVHGGWHRFRHPWFQSQAACTAFLHGRGPNHEDGGRQ